MKVFLVAVLCTLAVSVSGAACGTTLDKADCDTCTEGTHLFVCSTCHQCTSDTAACSSGCSGNGFVTEGTKCLKCPAIANCPRAEISCTATAGAVTATSADCGNCAPGFKKVAGTATAAAKCVAKTAIANCDVLGDCTLKADKSGCAAFTQVCTTCKAGFKNVAKTAATEEKCVAKTAIANCDVLGDCTLKADKSGCAAFSQVCTTCKPGFKNVAKTAATEEKCEACASTTAACGTGCTVAEGAFTDGTTCKVCGETTTEANCVAAKCSQLYKFAWGKCRRNVASNAIAGRNQNDIDTTISCAAFSGANVPAWTYKTCTKAYVTGDVATCTKCSESACTEGTCKTATNEFKSGKCEAKSGTGGSGGGTGKTNNTNNTNTSSFGIKVEQSIVGLIAVLAFIC